MAGFAEPVFHGVFYIKDKRDAHSVFIQQSGKCFPLRVTLDGAFRIRTYIRAFHIGEIIFAVKCSLWTHLTSHGNTHAGSGLYPQFAERTVFPFGQLSVLPGFFCKTPQQFFHILFLLVHAKPNGPHKLMHVVTFFPNLLS